MLINELPSLPEKIKKIASDFSKTIKLPAKKSPQPVAIGPFGPCCVGKTTTMTCLAKELPVVSINHDKIRLFMRQRGITDTEGNKILYNHLLIVHLAKQYLNKGYSVILDRDFGTNNKNVLAAADNEMKKLGIKFFLISIKSPSWFIKRKIQTRKLIPAKNGGIPDRKTAMDCYLYSLKHYKNNYIRLKSRAISTVDTSKPIPSQLKRIVVFLKKEIGV